MPWRAASSPSSRCGIPVRWRPATANVLLGNVNPGGKLPETFYDGSAPVGQRFPQDTQPAPCADNTGGTGYYGTASGALPGNPGNCPLYPGIYTPASWAPTSMATGRSTIPTRPSAVSRVTASSKDTAVRQERLYTLFRSAWPVVHQVRLLQPRAYTDL